MTISRDSYSRFDPAEKYAKSPLGSDVVENPSMDILTMARAMGAARAELSRQSSEGPEAPTIKFDGWPTEVALDGNLDVEALVKAILAGVATGS